MLNCTCTSIYGDVQMCSSYHIWSQDCYWIYGKTPKFSLKAENEFKFGHLVSVVCVLCVCPSMWALLVSIRFLTVCVCAWVLRVIWTTVCITVVSMYREYMYV